MMSSVVSRSAREHSPHRKTESDPPEDELNIRKQIQFLMEHIPKHKPNLRFIHINLFDFLIDYIKERGLLEKAIVLQRTKGNNALLKALKGVLHEEKVARKFGEITKPNEHDLVLFLRRQRLSDVAITDTAEQPALNYG